MKDKGGVKTIGEPSLGLWLLWWSPNKGGGRLISGHLIEVQLYKG